MIELIKDDRQRCTTPQVRRVVRKDKHNHAGVIHSLPFVAYPTPGKGPRRSHRLYFCNFSLFLLLLMTVIQQAFRPHRVLRLVFTMYVNSFAIFLRLWEVLQGSARVDRGVALNVLSSQEVSYRTLQS